MDWAARLHGLIAILKAFGATVEGVGILMN